MNNDEHIIRIAVVSDAAALCRLNRDEMGYDYPPVLAAERLEQLLSSPVDRIFVAEAEGEVAGYVHAQHYELLYADPMKNIMGIAVSAEHKRKGIGAALLKAVEDWALCDGCAGVRLVSGATRTAAHEFYRRCGYTGGKEQLNFKKMLV